MIFQKSSPKIASEDELMEDRNQAARDEVDTVVGPSVTVEGDFASEGNIIVKGNVLGSVHTSKFLFVEGGAKIVANIRANSAKVSGEIKGNIKVKENLELTSTARILGDIEAKVLMVEQGALLFGKIAMPGLESTESRGARSGRVVCKRGDEQSANATT